MKKLLALLSALTLTACTTTLPPQAKVSQNYSLSGSRTASVAMDCTSVKSDDVPADSIPDYCQMLLAAVRNALRTDSGLKITDNSPDIGVNVKLEEMYGGNAQLRFWIGMGAGKSAITTSVSVTKEGKELAQGRIVETTTMPNLAGGTWSNDSVIGADVSLVAKRIAEFVINPDSFVEKPQSQALSDHR